MPPTPPKPVQPPQPRRFKTGARPTPRWKLGAAMPFRKLKAAPAQYAYVPKQLSMWGNDQYGDCVSAEEAFAKACSSPEIFISDSDVISWASSNGYLDGADLTSVMDSMRQQGFPGQGPVKFFNDGAHLSVDYTNEATLQAAIATGPVKIGIDASALPADAGNKQGWVATGGSPGQFQSEDHCVGLAGYGPAGWLFQQLGVPLPAGLDPAKTGYLLFTWSTLGFVDHDWILSTCGEAWVRNPTTVTDPPSPDPTPPTPPPPVPIPPPPPPPVVQGLTFVVPTTPPLAVNIAPVSTGIRGAALACLTQFVIALLSGTPMAEAVAQTVQCLES